MCDRQKRRLARHPGLRADIRCENALATSLPDKSVDHVVSAFGLKTFDEHQLVRLADELFRILLPGGSASLFEISLPPNKFLRAPYDFYISSVVPWMGKVLLGDIECYRMLGVYTDAFGSCSRFADMFKRAGFIVREQNHFFGCASSLILIRPRH
jgi:demethylmenaquinone methyltransferase/2-methoxy-6-polyprenyl-1,4-benzoquinol methylase